mgnify:FL=1|tara:strand:+ start:401 stop:1213 length:813 start_codon:yes stop_codon:yes gene_type:complete
MTLPSDIKIRSLSSLVLLSVLIFSLIRGETYFTVFLIIVSLFMFFEWMRLISKNYWIIRGFIASTGLAIILMIGSINSLSIITFFLSFLFLTIFSKLTIENYKMSSFGFIYISLSILTINWIRESDQGLLLLIIILSTIFVSDIAAYIFGSLLGGPKLFKVISPNKTLSGFIAAFIIGTFWFIFLTLNYSNSYNFYNIYVGFGIVFLSIIGDLLISSLKRKANIKDSGIFIPGHGGFLDRADSILPIFFLMPLYTVFMNAIENPSIIILG